MQNCIARWISKPVLVAAVTSAVAAAVILQIPSPARTQVSAAVPAGIEMMRLLKEEHATMTAFLAEQDARSRAAALVESEPEPDQQIVVADAEPEPALPPAADGKRPPLKHAHLQTRLAKLVARPPLSISPPPVMAAAPPPPPPPMPGVKPPPFARVYGWVHRASQLPRRAWAAAGEFMDERGPPIPPRPIPRV